MNRKATPKVLGPKDLPDPRKEGRRFLNIEPVYAIEMDRPFRITPRGAPGKKGDFLLKRGGLKSQCRRELFQMEHILIDDRAPDELEHNLRMRLPPEIHKNQNEIFNGKRTIIGDCDDYALTFASQGIVEWNPGTDIVKFIVAMVGAFALIGFVVLYAKAVWVFGNWIWGIF